MIIGADEGREDIGAATMRGADGRRHFLALDSLRGLCACLVALYHLYARSLFSLSPVIQNGFLFVDFFFVLSGFVIMRSYGDKLRSGMSTTAFMALRLGRIYPLHLAVLLLLLALQVVLAMVHRTGMDQDGEHSARGLLTSLLLLQAFTANGVGAWNAVSWSISAEFWTYLAFAVACRLFPKQLPILLLLAIAVSPFAMETATDRHLNACFTGSLARCFYGFGMGGLCLILWQRIAPLWSRIGYRLASIVEIGVVIACGVAVAALGAGPWSYLCPLVFAVAVLVFAGEAGLVSAFLKLRPALLLGRLSYSIYMIHELVFARLDNILAALHVAVPHLGRGDAPIAGWGTREVAADLVYVIGGMACVILFAYGTFRLIEEPGRLWSRRLVDRRLRRT